MTKADIVIKISKRLGFEKDVTAQFVETFMDEVKASVIAGDPVYLRGFGTFDIKHRKEKVGQHISKGTSIIIPAHNIPFFKAAKSFVASVKEKNK